MLFRAPGKEHVQRLLDDVGSVPFLSAVARLSRERGRNHVAIVVWTRVLQLSPDSVDAEQNLAKLWVLERKDSEAIPHLEAWSRLDPESSEAFGLLGVASIHLGRWAEASEALEKSLGIQADQPQLLSLSASALWKQHRTEEALAQLRRLVSIQPDNASALNDLGVMHLQLHRPNSALEAFSKAVHISPNVATIRQNIAISLRRLGRPGEALEHARFAVRLGEPTEAMVALLASTLNDLERYDEAEAAFLGHDVLATANSLKAYSQAVRGQCRHEEAAGLVRQGLEIDPHNADLWFFLGNLLVEQGRLTDAEEAFDRAILAAPRIGAYHRAKADIHRYHADDRHLAEMEELDIHRGVPAGELMDLKFALAKAYDDLSMFAKAFEYLQSANRAKRASSPYNEPGVQQLTQTVTQAFPYRIEPPLPSGKTDSIRPVFIVGMPRSGTTLIEQILARHSAVRSLGETPALHRSLDAVIFHAAKVAEQPISEEAFIKLGETYLDLTSAQAGESARFIDKLPSNFFFLGYIAKALPNARIIHVQRDPVDTCISLYSKLFTRTQDFSYDLGELGRYYRNYERLMDHWRSVLPEEAMLEVRYEDTVTNLEREARRMLAFLNLPWDEACLRPDQAAGPVMTASASQVRRPIYQTSIGRRAGYLPYLAELTKELES